MTVDSHGMTGVSPTVPDIPRVAGGRTAVPSRPGGSGAWSRWAFRTCWLWPALATAGLGACQINRPELWRDELASWSFASLSLSRLLATARVTDGAQAPYYLVLHYWIEVFGSSVPAMRALSVLAMAGAAVFVALAARDLAGPGTGTVAGLVFALVPSVSRFAQEVRFYALAACFAALATWLLVRALDRPSWARWAGYAAAMAAAGWFAPSRCRCWPATVPGRRCAGTANTATTAQTVRPASAEAAAGTPGCSGSPSRRRRAWPPASR